MPGSRFFWQLYAGYVLLVLVCATVVGIALSKSITDYSLDQIRQQLRGEAILLEPTAKAGLDDSTQGQFAAQIRHMAAKVQTRVTVIADDGTVLADSRRDPSGLDNHANRPEIEEARERGEGFQRRFSRTLGREMLYYARKVTGQDGRIGYVRTALLFEVIGDQLDNVRELVFLGALIAALVALGLGLLVARRVTAPVTIMTEAARSIAAGDFASRVPIGSTNEIGELASAFNAMAEQLTMRIDTITKERKVLETILSGMVEGVVAIDQDERVVHMNEVAGRLLEADPRESIGNRIWETTRVNEIAKALTSSLSGGKEVGSQARLLRDGGESLVEINAAPLHDGAQALVGAVVVFHDVTAMRRLELVRREFVTNASHELKTPITAIRGFLETLAANPDMDEATRQKFLDRAAGQGARLSTLVTDLLRLSQLELKEGPETLEPIDVREVAQSAIRDHVGFASEKGVELRCETGAEPLLARSDAPTLTLILDNLIDNGIKYTKTGGAVVIRTFAVNGHVFAEVEDNGIGIAPTDQERVFERFYRVDKARSRELGGTGLGLAIVKHACGVLGGEVSLESAPGQGSTFRVRLPAV